MGKASKQVKTAKKVRKTLQKSVDKTKTKIRTKTKFTRGKIRKIKSKPTVLKSLTNEIRKKTNEKVNYHQILLNPLSSDKTLQNLEERNTITFRVNPKSKKAQIKEAFIKLYKMKIRKINTMHAIKQGYKKAYIRLQNDGDALNLASKIGCL